MDKEKIINENSGLVKSIASKYCHYGVGFDDLYQEGVMGIMEAAKRFDETKGAKFSTYATYFVKGSILDYLKKEKSINIIDMDIYENENIEFYRVESESPQEKEEEYIKTAFVIPDDFPEAEKAVLELSLVEGKPFKEIARVLGISRERVRQLKQKGLRRLKINKKLTQDLKGINHNNE
ncbi:MAG: sigma-70 family RNA polymerase sigma factor [Candidatus Goldbacteria bacterium]|nr:sigma-70 family RNA polymerase sigma factor [Candidatus Goldiibacteriota bacterium]